MSNVNFPSPDTDPRLSGSGNVIESRSGIAAFDGTLALLGGSAIAFAGSRAFFTGDLPMNFLHSGVIGAATGVVTGAISYVMHRK